MTMKRIVFVMLSTLLLFTSTSSYSIRADETDSFEIPAINTGIIDLDKDQNIIIKTDEGVWTILLFDNLNDGKNSQETWQLGDYDKNVTASYQKGTQYITLSACFRGNISSVKSTMTSIHNEQCVCTFTKMGKICSITVPESTSGSGAKGYYQQTLKNGISTFSVTLTVEVRPDRTAIITIG